MSCRDSFNFLPNLYGEDPAIQISATRTTKVDATTLAQVEQVLKSAGVDIVAAQRDEKSLKVRFRDTDAQLKARDTVQRALGDNYTVALNLWPATPAWFGWINANLNSLSRVQDANARSEGTVNILEYMQRVNPMLAPDGQADLGRYSIRWKAESISPVAEGVDHPRGGSLYQLALYRTTVAVSSPPVPCAVDGRTLDVTFATNHCSRIILKAISWRGAGVLFTS